MRKIELLSPAGDIDKMKVAYRYGADAVYLGGKAFNLRARSSNFAKDELDEAVRYAHSIGKKVYVALNILAHDREINALPAFVKHLEQIGVDAVIVADLGIIDLVREYSDLPIHISTQASSTNWRSVKMYKQLGAKRVVLGREVSIAEMKKIKDAVPDMEIEVFVHGSMCMTYSGRCNLSSYFAERDGNRGSCANTCRWKYAVVEERRPGEYFPVYEDETGTYMYNSKDLCTVEFLDQLLEAGVDGLKIEGRMKSLLYVSTTTRVYRQALESYKSGSFQYDPQWRLDLESYSNRGYTSGFYFGKLDKNSENRVGGYRSSHRFIGHISSIENGVALVDVKDKFLLNDTLELTKPNGCNITVPVTSIINARNQEKLDVAQPNMLVHMTLGPEAEMMDVIRKEITQNDELPK